MKARISPAYLEEQRWLHDQPAGYGGKGDRWATAVHRLAATSGAASILDYGCGQGALARELARRGVTAAEYDPAIPGKDDDPAPADLVVCTDVLEHVEEPHLRAVLAHLQQLTHLVLFVSIGLKPAGKTLRDGRNAHITLKKPATWRRLMWNAGLELEHEYAGDRVKHFTSTWRPRR